MDYAAGSEFKIPEIDPTISTAFMADTVESSVPEVLVERNNLNDLKSTFVMPLNETTQITHNKRLIHKSLNVSTDQTTAQIPAIMNSTRLNLKEQAQICDKNTKNLTQVLKEPPFRGKLTTTTILRQHQILEANNKVEREKIEQLVNGFSSSIDHQKWTKEKQEQAELELEKLKTMQILDAKLAYQRAISAAREVTYSKKIKASTLREERQLIKEKNNEQRKLELERRKLFANCAFQNEMSSLKRAGDETLRRKQDVAKELKEHNLQLKELARQKEIQELEQRDNIIKQIQAARMIISKPAEPRNRFETSNHGLLNEMCEIETQVRLRNSRLQKTVQRNTIREKIIEAKNEKSNKLLQALKEIEQFQMKKVEHISSTKSRNAPERHIQLNDAELREKVEQLQKLKIQNELPKVNKNS